MGHANFTPIKGVVSKENFSKFFEETKDGIEHKVSGK
jgi:hypothetical protein